MASKESNVEKRLRRSNSEGTLSEDGMDKVDETDGYHRRNSANFGDLKPIEELVTCPIHLGMMDDPRKLKCQHAFCTKCLLDLVRNNGNLICPICRATGKSNDVMSLPPALVEKQLIEVIMEKRMKECQSSSFNEDTITKEGKEELVKHLLKELNGKNSHIFKYDGPEERSECSSLQRKEVSNRLKSPCSSVTSSTYDIMDIETIRENMLKYSSYKVVKRNNLKRTCKNCPIKNYYTSLPEFSTFDIHHLKDQPTCYEIVFVDSNTNQCLVYSEREFRFFYIQIGDVYLKPLYIRIFKGELFITGCLKQKYREKSVFVQCNMYGEVKREVDVCNYGIPKSVTPMIYGFDFDEKGGSFFMCLPHLNGIRVYDTAKIMSRKNYNFDNNQPEYVAFYEPQNQLWVSCPLNRRILIADVSTGAFVILRTDQINEAIPRMIYCTDDDRVMFLDSQANRFIWIKQRGGYILTQRLHLPSLHRDIVVKSFQVLPLSMIVIRTFTEFLVFQPEKLKNKEGGDPSTCVIL